MHHLEALCRAYAAELSARGILLPAVGDSAFEQRLNRELYLPVRTYPESDDGHPEDAGR